MLAMLERERVRKETMTSSPSAHMLLPTISTSCRWRWSRRWRASCQPPFEKLQKLQWIFNQMGRWRSSLWSAPSLSPSFQTETWNPEDKDCIWKIFVWSTLDIFFICLEIVNNEIQRKWSESFLKWSFENKWCWIWKRCHGSPFGLNLRCYLFVRHPEEQLITLKVAGGTPLSNLQRTPGGKTLTLKKTWEWTNSPFWHFIPTTWEMWGHWWLVNDMKWNQTMILLFISMNSRTH